MTDHFSEYRAGGASTGTQTSLLDNTVISGNKRKGFLTLHNNKIHEVSPLKVIQVGGQTEVFTFEKPIIFFNGLKKIRLIFTPEEKEKAEIKRIERKEEYKRRNAVKAVTRIRHITQTTFEKNGKMLTLTFRDQDSFDIKNLTDCHKRLKAFVRKLNSSFPHLKYIGVPEFQDKNGRGAVHYHLLYNLPYIPQKELEKLWGYGFVFIERIMGGLGVGMYVAKYLMKAYKDPRFEEHRKYITSKNLKSPEPKYGPEAYKIAMKLIHDQKKCIFKKSYTSHFNGKITFYVYNHNNSPAHDKDEK